MSQYPGEVFARTAEFDSGIRQLIPRYEEMLEILSVCLPPTPTQILELGSGTGELSLQILRRYPQAKLTAVDYSPRMLEYAQSKIGEAGYGERVRWIQADFGDWALDADAVPVGSGFDACVSSLAIHHLTDEIKLRLFQRISQVLNPGGCFWNADPSPPQARALDSVYETVKEEWTRQQGTTREEVRARLGNSDRHGHSSHDHLITLSSHLEMLQQAGFQSIDVPWTYFGLAVVGGYV